MKSPVMCAVVSAASAVATAAATLFAPPAAAMNLGNYNLHMPDRRDFHTYVFSMMSRCRDADNNSRSDCIQVQAIPQPIAKAANTYTEAILVDGRYTMVIDDPFGLRCGDIYYGPTIPTHDVYTWDATTLAGQMVSTFDAGCDGAPGGSLTYPLFLTRM
ncbi:hypothetical protein [Mycolicibacterium goodii]|uniref:Secreted protein n=1 Tax=Mycolicibacterium goodii TaxID=134601 RepID=A0ABS6HJN0_MYCGD|nr:hypothetical protein [Mycolicibacterium goodii]MBU8810507.1 hypothetical protein [Mycolicibacterium goodii]MBU8814928.1 hypothetical protein [Mycolicibacterium goodii]MBU8821392.1 hypothetical protein [Mycolicibacterium goodii]MBU8831451.1 hypothetical protein [Mycolicibacterium goodii]MBU8837778.1 hypothetical protein [Mycolicibacterium goodii]